MEGEAVSSPFAQVKVLTLEHYSIYKKYTFVSHFRLKPEVLLQKSHTCPTQVVFGNTAISIVSGLRQTITPLNSGLSGQESHKVAEAESLPPPPT